MTKKRLFVLIGNILISAAIGYYNLGSSMNDKLSVILSCIVFLLWMGFFVWLMRDKNFAMESFYRMSLILTTCFISGICLSQSPVGLLFCWPFIGIARCFSGILDERLAIFILYCIPALLSLTVVMKNKAANKETNQL